MTRTYIVFDVVNGREIGRTDSFQEASAALHAAAQAGTRCDIRLDTASLFPVLSVQAGPIFPKGH